MGLLTWIIIGVVILAIIGLGLGTFLSGVWQGAQEVGSNPAVQNATGEAKEYIGNVTKNITNQIVEKALQK
jgi:hypothetical protein